MAKRVNSVAPFSLIDGETLQWDHGSTGMCKISARDIFPEFRSMTSVQQYTVLNGIKQKCADGMASCKTAAERFERQSGIIENLKKGVWSQRGVATVEKKVNDRPFLLEALIAAHPDKDAVKLSAYVAAKKDAEIAALCNLPAYATLVAAARQKAIVNVDVDELVSGIENL